MHVRTTHSHSNYPSQRYTNVVKYPFSRTVLCRKQSEFKESSQQSHAKSLFHKHCYIGFQGVKFGLATMYHSAAQCKMMPTVPERLSIMEFVLLQRPLPQLQCRIFRQPFYTFLKDDPQTDLDHK